MGKNKLRKFAEMQEMECVYQYPPSVLLNTGFPYRGKWNEQVFHRQAPIVLELGCGKGEYAVGLAAEQPDKNYIGIDIKGARMYTGARKSIEQGLENCVFLRTDIGMLSRFFAPGEISEIWITFPDPQMKKVRKRLTGTQFLNLYRQVLELQGVIRLKTDSPFLYLYTTALLRVNNIAPIAVTDDLYNPDCEIEIPQIKTFYEQQWLSRGMKIKYVAFCLPEGELKEPEDEIPMDDYRSLPRGQV